jgi:spore coat protein CotF
LPTNNPVDIAIAGFINKDLKQCVSTNAMSACECTTPELRQAFATISQEGIRRQERLATMMSQKGWYVAPPSDQATINTLMPQLQAATQGLGANAGVALGRHPLQA